jgi:predicted Zn-dependent peptidase
LSELASEFSATVHRLENGLTVIHQRTPATPVVAVDVWVNAGAVAEPEPWLGIAHFLEHMIFKGTAKIPPGQFDQVIESRGGVTNAATSHDYAHFFIHTAADHLPATLPYLAELLLNAAIPDDEFLRERDVVLEEIRQAEDDPDWIGFQSLVSSVYQRHPYGRSVLGEVDTLLARSPQEMRCFHRANYQPENMAVVVVGDVALEPTLDLVSQSFTRFTPCHNCCPVSTVEAEPPMTGIRRQQLYLPRLELARLMLAWVGPGVDYLRGAYGLDLISVLLTGGRSSRLVRELREERQLVQGIDCSFSLQRDSSLFTISAWLVPENLDRVEAIIGDRLSQLAGVPISRAELERYQRFLCNDYAFSTETAIQLAGLYGYYHTIAQAELATSYPAQIRSFTPDELQQLVAQYLTPYRYAAVTLAPLETLSGGNSL